MEAVDKRELVEQILTKGDAMLCIDSRHADVQVPVNYCGKVDLRLIINLNFRRPFQMLDEGIDAELLFGGAPFRCWIPYECLWGVYNPDTADGYFWPDFMPGEILNQFMKGQDPGTAAGAEAPALAQPVPAAPQPAPVKATSRKGRPKLQVIPGGKKD